MTLLADLFYIKISVLVKLVLAHYDLSVEDDHDLIVRRNNHQIILLFSPYVYFSDYTLYYMVRHSAKEGEHGQVLG